MDNQRASTGNESTDLDFAVSSHPSNYEESSSTTPTTLRIQLTLSRVVLSTSLRPLILDWIDDLNKPIPGVVVLQVDLPLTSSNLSLVSGLSWRVESINILDEPQSSGSLTPLPSPQSQESDQSEPLNSSQRSILDLAPMRELRK